MSGENMSNATAMHHGPDACPPSPCAKIAVGPDPREEVLFLLRLKGCLTKWCARYAEAEHAKKHVAQSRALLQEIDQRILALERT